MDEPLTYDDMYDAFGAARKAARCAPSTFLDPRERYEVALEAVAEFIAIQLAQGCDVPRRAELVAAGMSAIVYETSHYRRHHGWQDNEAGFSKFWWNLWDQNQHLGMAFSDPAKHLAVIALGEVLADLPERHQSTLYLLALHGDPQAAAEAAGVPYSTMQTRILTARRAAYALWFDWEQAPEPTFDRRNHIPPRDYCGRGHEFTPENTRWRRATNGRGQKRACKACDRLAEQRRKERAA